MLVACLREQNEAIRDEIKEWKESYKNLQAETKQLFEEIQASIQDKEKELLDTLSKNKELLSYIEKMKNCSQKKYSGKYISEVKEKFPTLKTFMSRAETALSF